MNEDDWTDTMLDILAMTALLTGAITLAWASFVLITWFLL